MHHYAEGELSEVSYLVQINQLLGMDEDFNLV